MSDAEILENMDSTSFVPESVTECNSTEVPSIVSVGAGVGTVDVFASAVLTDTDVTEVASDSPASGSQAETTHESSPTPPQESVNTTSPSTGAITDTESEVQISPLSLPSVLPSVSPTTTSEESDESNGCTESSEGKGTETETERTETDGTQSDMFRSDDTESPLHASALRKRKRYLRNTTASSALRISSSILNSVASTSSTVLTDPDWDSHLTVAMHQGRDIHVVLKSVLVSCDQGYTVILPMMLLLSLRYGNTAALLYSLCLPLVIKGMFRRLRPIDSNPAYSCETDWPFIGLDLWSFPSGRASTGVTAALLSLHSGSAFSYITWIIFMLISIVARVHRGLNWASDVLAGAVLGLSMYLIILLFGEDSTIILCTAMFCAGICVHSYLIDDVLWERIDTSPAELLHTGFKAFEPFISHLPVIDHLRNTPFVQGIQRQGWKREDASDILHSD